MAPLSLDLPKPVMPLHNRPILEYTLRRLSAWGVRDTLINLHHGAEEILRTAMRIRPPAMRLTFSFEPLLMNTGGALSRAAWFFDDAPCLIVNGDIYFARLDPRRLTQALRAPTTIAALWMHPRSGPRTVALHPDGRVHDFAVADPGGANTFTFCGLHLVSPRILDFIPTDRPSSIIDAYRRAIKAGHTVRGVACSGAVWTDLGTPERYLAAHKGRRVVCGQRVNIGSGCRLENCVLWDDVRLLARTTVRNTIIGRGVTTGGLIDRPTIALARMRDAGLTAMVRKLGWPPERTAITPLAARGSARDFYRIHLGRKTAILVREDGHRRENRYYAADCKFLEQMNLPVPGVLAHDATARTTVFSDGGNRNLTDALMDMRHKQRMMVYRRILEIMHRWHNIDADRPARVRVRLMPRFSPTLFAWELNYFAEHCLAGYFGLHPDRQRVLIRELRAATRPLHSLSQVLIHRDLQSSNILVSGRNLTVIDFQGMRFGPAVYDLASLLYDPYVRMASSDRRSLFENYRQKTVTEGNSRAGNSITEALFHRAALQRLSQALGAFARLGGLPGTRQFSNHIPAALDNMRQAADIIGETPYLSQWLEENRRSRPTPKQTKT